MKRNSRQNHRPFILMVMVAYITLVTATPKPKPDIDELEDKDLQLNGASSSGRSYSLRVSNLEMGGADIGLFGEDKEDRIRIPSRESGDVKVVELLDDSDQAQSLSNGARRTMKLYISGTGYLDHLLLKQNEKGGQNKSFQIQLPAVLEKANESGHKKYIGKLVYGNFTIETRSNDEEFEVKLVDGRPKVASDAVASSARIDTVAGVSDEDEDEESDYGSLNLEKIQVSDVRQGDEEKTAKDNIAIHDVTDSDDEDTVGDTDDKGIAGDTDDEDIADDIDDEESDGDTADDEGSDGEAGIDDDDVRLLSAEDEDTTSDADDEDSIGDADDGEGSDGYVDNDDDDMRLLSAEDEDTAADADDEDFPGDTDDEDSAGDTVGEIGDEDTAEDADNEDSEGDTDEDEDSDGDTGFDDDDVRLLSAEVKEGDAKLDEDNPFVDDKDIIGDEKNSENQEFALDIVNPLAPVGNKLTRPGKSLGSWGPCSVSCGKGVQTRQRYCTADDAEENAEDEDICEDQRGCVLSSCKTANRDKSVQSAVGQPSVLRCGYDTKLPVSRMYWLGPDGERISDQDSTDKYATFGDFLVINHADVDDAGTYHCVIILKGGEELTADASLAVQDCSSDTACQNGGSCVEVSEDDDPDRPFKHVTCSCREGYSGDYCQTEVMGSLTKLMVGVFLLVVAVVVLVCLCWCRTSNKASIRWDRLVGKGQQEFSQAMPPDEAIEQFPQDVTNGGDPTYLDIDTAAMEAYNHTYANDLSFPSLPTGADVTLTMPKSEPLGSRTVSVPGDVIQSARSDPSYEVPVTHESSSSSASCSDEDYVNMTPRKKPQKSIGLAERLSIRRKKHDYGALDQASLGMTSTRQSVNAAVQTPVSIWELIKVGQRFKSAKRAASSWPAAQNLIDSRENNAASGREVEQAATALDDDDAESQADSNINQNNPRGWSVTSDDEEEDSSSKSSDSGTTITQPSSSSVVITFSRNNDDDVDAVSTETLSNNASAPAPHSSPMLSSITNESESESVQRLDELFDDVEATLNRALARNIHHF